MKKSFDDYRLISARGAGSVWEGPDHLLYIESAGFLLPFTEKYRRIDYSKIQSVSYGRTSLFAWTLSWTGALLMLLLIGVVLNLDEKVPLVMFSSFAALMLVIFLVNLIKGPTCVCKVQTAVQVLTLKPLNRLRPTLRAVTRIMELAQFHQGGAALTAEALAQMPVGTAAWQNIVAGATKPPFTGSKAATGGLLLMLLGCAGAIADVWIDNLAFFVVKNIVLLAAFSLCCIGLAQVTRMQLPGALKASLWGLVGTLVLGFGLGYCEIFMASLSIAKNSLQSRGRPVFGGESDLWRWLSHASFAELGWLAWAEIILAGVGIVLVLIGLPSALRPPAVKAVAAAPTPVPAVPAASPSPEIQPAANEPPPPEA